MTQTPQMQAALAAPRVISTILIEAELPGTPMQLLYGSGAIHWGTKVFSDVDETYGTLAAVDEIEDGDGDEAAPWSFVMLPHSDAAAAALCSPALQGSPVRLWLAAISPVTGLLVPDPDLLLTLRWDIGTLSPDHRSREVEVECVSEDDLLLEDEEGARLSDAHHQSIYPGETGCANVTGLTVPRYWGMASPRIGGPVNAPARQSQYDWEP